MGKAEKVEERVKKRADLLKGEKLKHGVLVGKRLGNSTPSPTWKFGVILPDGTGTLVQDLKLFPNSVNTSSHSARKLGANLWEMMQQQRHKINRMVAKVSKTAQPVEGHHSGEKLFDSPEESDNYSELQPTSSSNIHLEEQVAAASPTQHNLQFTDSGQCPRPLSPAACYCSSMEMPPHQPTISPSGSIVVKKLNFGESNPSHKTSTELLRVLNRIWSLEEKHALDMSLVKMLRRELDQSQIQIRQLLQDKKRDRKEIKNLTKQMTEHKIARKEEQDRIRDAVKLVEIELKLRRNSEKLHQELSKELLEMKSLFMNALRDLEQERKARKLLEDLCDEFAKGIRDCEKQARLLKQKSCEDQIGIRDGNDGLVLHMSEAWLDERTHSHSYDIAGRQSAVDRLYIDIETFLHAKRFGKHAFESDALALSLESFHLNEPASAPWKEIDEGDSVGHSVRRSQLFRTTSLKQGNDSSTQLGEITGDKETARSRKVKKDHVQHSRKDSDAANLPLLANESDYPRMPRKGELMLRSLREGRNRITYAELQDTTGYPTCLTSDHEKNFTSAIVGGPLSPVKKWASASSSASSSSRESKSIKFTTLRAKLMEARLEAGQQSKGFPSQVD